MDSKQSLHIYEWREEYIVALQRADCSYDTILRFVNFLQHSLASPPYVEILKRIISEKFGSHFLGNYGGHVMWSILSFLYGEEDVTEVNRSLFYDYLHSEQLKHYRHGPTSGLRRELTLCPRMPSIYKFETGRIEIEDFSRFNV